MSEELMTFLEQAGKGCISGQISEWPQLKPSCAWAHKRIEELERKYKTAEAYIADMESQDECIHVSKIQSLETRVAELEKENRLLKVENEYVDGQKTRIAALTVELQKAVQQLKLVDSIHTADMKSAIRRREGRKEAIESATALLDSPEGKGERQ